MHCEVIVSLEDTHLLEVETVFSFLPVTISLHFPENARSKEAICEELKMLSWRKLNSFYS
jgi:hypothetical protein